MSTEPIVSERNKPWTKTKVIEIHNQFDHEFDSLNTEKDVEQLMQRFFGFTGIVEEALRDLAGSSETMENLMETAFELISFRAYIYTCFFLNHFPEEVVQTWWKEKGFRSWSGKEVFSHPVTAKLKSKFDESLKACTSTAEFQKLRDEYVGPHGHISKALAGLEKKPLKEQIEAGADLFNLKSYIDYSLFAIEFSMKASHWTDHEVRGLVYKFERDLFLAETEEDVEKVLDDYFKHVEALGTVHKKQKKDIEQVALFKESLQRFKDNKPKA